MAVGIVSDEVLFILHVYNTLPVYILTWSLGSGYPVDLLCISCLTGLVSSLISPRRFSHLSTVVAPWVAPDRSEEWEMPQSLVDPLTANISPALTLTLTLTHKTLN